MSPTPPAEALVPRMNDPLAELPPDPSQPPPAGIYETALAQAVELRGRCFSAASHAAIERQHQKGRMTVFERIRALTPEEPEYLFTNWGPNLDGASLLTAILRIGERCVACYGHDFTVRAGSMDATNGEKLADANRRIGVSRRRGRRRWSRAICAVAPEGHAASTVPALARPPRGSQRRS